MQRLLRVGRAATALMLVFAPVARAQGGISVQGFGYPGGQLSTRALGTGGALGDFDANSPLNPAALSLSTRSTVYMQYDPEFRSFSTAAGNASTTTARFPVLGITGRFGNATLGLSYSNFLDRSWTNTYADTPTVGGKIAPSQITAQSTGGISDVRAAVSYRLTDKLFLGLGVHVFPGENRTLLGRSFADSLEIGSFTEANIYNFTGTGLSLGIVGTPIPHVNLAASARFGGAMTMRNGDSTIVGKAHVPNKWSLSAAFDGFQGSSLAIRYGSEKWSSMQGLGNAGLGIHDANDLSAGLEFAGPKVATIPSAVRFGFRTRDLPFSLGPQAVTEQSLTAGLGIPVAAGRGAIDLALDRARRTTGDLHETGWILSVGLSIKP